MDRDIHDVTRGYARVKHVVCKGEAVVCKGEVVVCKGEVVYARVKRLLLHPCILLLYPCILLLHPCILLFTFAYYSSPLHTTCFTLAYYCFTLAYWAYHQCSASSSTGRAGCSGGTQTTPPAHCRGGTAPSRAEQRMNGQRECICGRSNQLIGLAKYHAWV